ncbi:acyl-CoA dehydrogenase family protein [Cupriavidus numazuensis]|uniref:Acryloyl-CoA reductase (NADH) n=1 Tax=Cupriavidus numazuensis TaxID=221992 RepID=A0ABN7QAH5_9BURK|nr:acyl-CoA dehydrogenase [Cupriavidus numazuensis]CAG2160467.1 Acryloyl-CoA reductase (NADH) [Cupriavidus numazuensis]
MDFSYNETQRMLAESLRRLIDTTCTFAHRRQSARHGASFDPALWSTLAELGVLGLTVPESYGGFGESAASQLVVQRELGRGLVLEPIIPAAIATAILSTHGSAAQREAWLPAISRGERVVTVAYLERQSRYRPGAIETSAAADGAGFRLNGLKTLVWHGAAAQGYLVSARLGDAVALFLLPRDTAGLTVTSYPTIDGQQGADLALRDVRLPADALIGTPHDGLAALLLGLDHGIAAQCAAAAGAMERLIEITTEYLGTRQQFGKQLATFQALQHRVADMLVHKEIALSMAFVAAQALDDADPASRRRKLAGAKVLTAKAARFVGQQAVQLHGGMGMTDELEVGDYFKYLAMTDVLLGDTDYHMEQYSAAMAAA